MTYVLFKEVDYGLINTGDLSPVFPLLPRDGIIKSSKYNCF